MFAKVGAVWRRETRWGGGVGAKKKMNGRCGEEEETVDGRRSKSWAKLTDGRAPFFESIFKRVQLTPPRLPKITTVERQRKEEGQNARCSGRKGRQIHTNGRESRR